jgi:hypothetical protein
MTFRRGGSQIRHDHSHRRHRRFAGRLRRRPEPVRRPAVRRGVDGRLHTWMLDHADENRAEIDAITSAGAYIMGRNMFGPGRGEWDLEWKGWWGPEPPYHAPVFVLTHHPREPLEMDGGTTFTFVTDGPASALAQARAAAGDRQVAIARGRAQPVPVAGRGRRAAPACRADHTRRWRTCLRRRRRLDVGHRSGSSHPTGRARDVAPTREVIPTLVPCRPSGRALLARWQR